MLYVASWIPPVLIRFIFIQATMPSTLKHPAYVPMWRGAKLANAIVAVCYFPIAVAGYWAYGSMVSVLLLFGTAP